jgi:serine protease AprX
MTAHSSTKHKFIAERRTHMTNNNVKLEGIGTLVLALALSISFAGTAMATSGAGTQQQGPAAAHSAKISVDLDTSKSEPTDVIVQFTAKPTQHHLDKVLSRGGKLKSQFHSVKGAAFRVAPNVLEDLAKDPEVAFITPDRKLKGHSSPAYDYYQTTINTAYGWNLGLNGSGIGVAVIDSGILPNADLGSRVVYNQSFVPGETSITTDLYGHGTHVAGLIGGNGAQSTGSNSSLTIKGVAPNVNLLNLRVLDENGSGADSTIIAGIDQAIALKSTYNIRVINLSVGRSVYETYTQDPLCQAVESAWQAGIVVVVAAGNDGRINTYSTEGYGTLEAPGNDPYVLTVGAMNTNATASLADDQITSYSSKGPTPVDQFVKPDVVAPGNLVISLRVPGSTLDNELPGNLVPTSLYQTNGTSAPSSAYFFLSGTSMATPVVAGTVALMLQQHPTLTPDQVKARIMLTANKNLQPYTSATDPSSGITFNAQADVFTVGAGYLNVQAALSNTNLAPATVGSAMSPGAVYTNTGAVQLAASGSSVLGSGSGTWSPASVWGTNVLLSGGAQLWGGTAIWGFSTETAGSSVVWGKSVVWGASAGPDDGEAFMFGDE